MSTLIERPDVGSGATAPGGVYVNILDGTAGALMVRTRPVTLKQLFGSVVSDPAALLTTDMTKKQAPLFAMPIAFLMAFIFSKSDASARAKAEVEAFEDQYVRAQTGYGAASAANH